MDQMSIVEDAPKHKGMSLKWKWALGSAVGVFLIFIIFSWFVVEAFSNQIIKDEREELQSTMQIVKQRLARLDADELLPARIDQQLLPTDGRAVTEVLADPVSTYLARQDIIIRVYNEHGAQVFPVEPDGNTFRKVDAELIDEEMQHGTKILVGRMPLINHNHKRIGTIVLENHLVSYHSLFQRVYTIITVLIVLGIILIALWGYWLANYLLRPVDDIERVINEMQIDPQSQSRIPISETTHDELTELATLTNLTFDRMQRFILAQHQFVEDVSHELRTPVAIVKGHMELLNRWGKDDPQILDESIQASLSEITRMQGLVQEMLDLTRADQVEITFRDGDTDVKELINAIYNNFKMIHEDFIFGLDDSLSGPTIINMSRDHLEQIMIILSDNAVKYSQTRKEIHYAVSRGMNQVQIAVQDFGEGISQEDADRVFDRFYRVDKARSRTQGGNGLGLSIAEKLVQGYGGSIKLESAIGKGSIFIVTLPIKQAKK
ncbi:MAG: HAMP domain-containing histidine kinase [Lactobacillaceae bacterium]|jgi:signal transduction histidine kinase|nr:HAMP domain-containing histidine kinase [Lactobacillaceae bacterium]